MRRFFYSILFIDIVRFLFCKLRWILLRRRLRSFENPSAAVGAETVSYNLTAFKHNAVFGMAKRMSLLLFPAAALLKDRLSTAKVLIVGPRTEDDIFWAKSLGLLQTIGLDLFSYSKQIRLGDIHKTDFADGEFDAVLLGWMISYSSKPEVVIEECRRILKPGGYLGIGIESNPALRGVPPQAPRMNALNSTEDLIALVKAPVAFSNEPHEAILYDCAVGFKILKGPAGTA